MVACGKIVSTGRLCTVNRFFYERNRVPAHSTVCTVLELWFKTFPILKFFSDIQMLKNTYTGHTCRRWRTCHATCCTACLHTSCAFQYRYSYITFIQKYRRDCTVNSALHCKKRLAIFPPGRVWLVTSRLGTGKSLTFFYSVIGQ